MILPGMLSNLSVIILDRKVNYVGIFSCELCFEDASLHNTYAKNRPMQV